MKREKILAVPRLFVDELGTWDGFRGLSISDRIEMGRVSRFVDRGPAEVDETLKQIIPYVVLRHKDEVFTYRRGKAGSEQRLHGLRSLGVGGHVDYEDFSEDEARESGQSKAAWHAINLAASREVAEEVGFDGVNLTILGLINEDSTSVGRVHLGLLCEAWVDPFRIASREPCLLEPRFEKLFSVSVADYERWSQIAIEFLRNGTGGA